MKLYTNAPAAVQAPEWPLMRSVRHVVSQGFAAWAERQRLNRDYRRLMAWSDFELRDIGLVRGEVRGAIYGLRAAS